MTDARPDTPFLDLFEQSEHAERTLELLGAGPIPWDGPPPTAAEIIAAAESNATLKRWADAERLALDWWREQQWVANAEAAELHVGSAVDSFMTDTLPARAGRRARAQSVFRTLVGLGCSLAVTHGALVVEPWDSLGVRLKYAVGQLRSELVDVLDERGPRAEA